MKVKYSYNTKEDFRKHHEYLRRKGKSDGHQYQKYELNGIQKALKNDITNGLENIQDHKNSIFPSKYEYNHLKYKCMLMLNIIM